MKKLLLLISLLSYKPLAASAVNSVSTLRSLGGAYQAINPADPEDQGHAHKKLFRDETGKVLPQPAVQDHLDNFLAQHGITDVNTRALSLRIVRLVGDNRFEEFRKASLGDARALLLGEVCRIKGQRDMSDVLGAFRKAYQLQKIEENKQAYELLVAALVPEIVISKTKEA